MTPQQVAEPADEPQAALIATCTCGRRIWRLALDSARQATPANPGDPGPTECIHCRQRIRRFGQTRRWCHDHGDVQCAAATCSHGTPLTAPHCQGCDDIRDDIQ